ncbi:MAG: alpha/beta hydrolase [Pseudomonadota bacterium]
MDEPTLYARRFGAPGSDGSLVFLNATGLNASCYTPLLQSVAFDGEILAMSLRGHGASTLAADPKALKSWHIFARDVEQFLAQQELAGPITIAGHSAGAVTALLTANRIGAMRVAMIEPVVIPSFAVWLARSPLKSVTIDKNPLAAAASKRRAHFDSLRHVEESYRKKRFFAGWNEEAFAGYLDEGFRPTGDGEGITLACAPAYEAACFGAQASGFWPHLTTARRRGAQCIIASSERQSTFPKHKHQRAEALGARVTILKGGHMLPVEDPVRAAKWLEHALRV